MVVSLSQCELRLHAESEITTHRVCLQGREGLATSRSARRPHYALHHVRNYISMLMQLVHPSIRLCLSLTHR